MHVVPLQSSRDKTQGQINCLARHRRTLFQVFSKMICLLLFSECQEALGMESGAISDSQISASSEFFNHAAIQGRLNFQETSVKAGAWVASSRNVNQWLQIDLGNQLTNVIRVATQGRHYSSQWVALHSQWVTKCKLQYSDDDVNFQYYREQGKTKDKVKIFCLGKF